MEEEKGLHFLEVYAKCSVDTCIKRDPKGLYKKALRGEIKNMTGIDDPFEDPLEPEVIIDTENESPDISANHILKALEKTG